ncbi:MAG: DUF971 domain-containing protein [Ignavibacteriaceae bacterium]|nr:DUF971 domain-containing protein [Ignavibacteriaceae bacterium]
MKPLKIKLSAEKDFLEVTWENGEETSTRLSVLRKNCPCANCADERSRQSASYFPIFSSDQVTIASIGNVGYYALSVRWKDGHSTGIYEYPFLYKLCKNN